MSVLAHNNKIIIAPNGKALNMQNLINLANATTGKSDTTLLDAIDHLIEGYGSGSFHKESGSVSFHAGANRISPVIPLQNCNFASCLFFMASQKLWLKVGDDWVEQSGIDFTGLTSQRWLRNCGITAGTRLSNAAFINTSGTTIAGGTMSFDNTAVAMMTSSTSTGYTWKGSYGTTEIDKVNNKITITGSASTGGYICTTTWGMTYKYAYWGWN